MVLMTDRALRRTIDVLISIDKKLKDAGIDPQKINLHKILILVFQAISTEDNPVIQEMYTNLLAAAIAGEKVEVDDIKILDILGGNDILILEAVYNSSQDSCRIHDLMYVTKLSKEEYETSIERLTNKALIQSNTLEQIDLSVRIALSNIDRDRGVSEYTKPGDIMLDLEVIEKSFQNALKRMIEAQTMSKYDCIKLTTYGQSFMRKCKGIITRSIETEQNP